MQATGAFLALTLGGIAAAQEAGEQSPPTIEKFGLLESEFKATGKYANPYTEVTAEAVITPPNGGATRTIPLYWDGGNSWKLRFSPDQTGTWTFKINSTDRGLDGGGGSVRCVASKRSGSIRPMKNFPTHFERQDGSPFWFLGDTAWGLVTDSSEEKHDRAAALRYIDARAGQGINVLHTMLLSEAGWGNQGGKPWEDLARRRSTRVTGRKWMCELPMPTAKEWFAGWHWPGAISESRNRSRGECFPASTRKTLCPLHCGSLCGIRHLFHCLGRMARRSADAPQH